jgi:hypothetical protein
MSALRVYFPTAFGFIRSMSERPKVGVETAGADTFVARVLYRFDVSQYGTDSAELHIECLGIDGDPGTVELHCVAGFDPFPDTTTQNPVVMDDLWFLDEGGVKVGEFVPTAPGWLEFSVPGPAIESLVSDDGYVGFLLRLADESIEAGNWYLFNSNEYAQNQGTDPPYVIYQR